MDPCLRRADNSYSSPAKELAVQNARVEAAWNSGCRRFDHAIKGFGGCPMATDQLTGNMPTENVLEFLKEKNIETGIEMKFFNEAMMEAGRVFPVE